MEDLKIGNRIKFLKEKISYKIMAFDDRFIICQKPYNPKRTFMYSIIDLKKNIRGADNCYCKFQYDDLEECKEALKELNSGDIEISYRNWCELDIEKVIVKQGK